MTVAIARMEGFERRIEGAYSKLEQAINSETQRLGWLQLITIAVGSGIIAATLVTVIPPAVRFVASFL